MKLTLQPGYNMIANNFVTVGEEELQKIPDMFQDDENATANMDSGKADRIDTWDAAQQQYVSYYRMTNRRETDFWWGKSGSVTSPTTDTFENSGDGAFYYNQKTEGTLTLTLSGQVKSTDTDITIAPGFNLVCNPYPVDLDFTELDWSNAVANMDSGKADRIDAWDAVGQQYVSYYRMTNRRETDFWWGKSGSVTTPTTDSIPAGQAFFYYSQKDSEWTLTLATPVSAASSGN